MLKAQLARMFRVKHDVSWFRCPLEGLVELVGAALVVESDDELDRLRAGVRDLGLKNPVESNIALELGRNTSS